jgi:predicted ester cyclase
VTDGHRETARRAWAAYVAGDVEEFAACLTNDWLEYGPDGDSSDLADNIEAMHQHRDAFPDKRVEILHDLVEGDLVAQHVVVTATHTGRYLGLEPTHKAVRIIEMIVHRMRDGLIAESWAITHGGGFYEQLTGHPAPESRENIS